MSLDVTTVLAVAMQIMIVAGLISIAVSLLVEYLIKSIFTNITTGVTRAVIVGLSLPITMLVVYIYLYVTSTEVTWLYITGAIFLGLLVAMMCTHGYDTIFSYVYGMISKIFASKSEVE